MLEIKDISIKFDKKIILDNTQFKANNNELTIIKGRSGIGKSTFLNTFLFSYDCKYIYNDISLMELSYEQKQQFIYEKMSFVHSIPLFINSMNIEEHINIIEKMNKKRIPEIEERLGITGLLNKYPSKLSGGEKSRVAFYLGLIKEPEIFILDEPTSSLDVENAKLVIDILVDYAHHNHTVIVSTHDYKLIEKADSIYEIKDKQLNLLNNINNNESYKVMHLNNIKKPKIRVKFGHLIFKLIMMILVSATLLTTVFASRIYSNYNSSYQNILNSASSLDIIVYKSKYENDYFTFSGNEYPFTNKEVNKLKSLDNIKSISNHYDIDYIDYDTFWHLDEIVDLKESSDKTLSVSLYNDNSLMSKKTFDDFSMHSFNETNDYSDLLEYNFHKEGIILSHDFFSYLYGNKVDKDNLYLEYILIIPQYNTTNVNEMILDDNSTVKVNHINCVMKKVKIPIAGILKEDTFIYNINQSKEYIYIPNNLLYKYVNQYKVNKTRKVYSIVQNEKYTYYFNKLPTNIGNYEIDQQLVQTPWSPNSYVVTVDNIGNVNKVVDEIEKLGFKTVSSFTDSDTFNILNEDNKYILIAFMATIFIVIYAFYIYLKYLLLVEEKETKDYLTNLGYNNQEVNSFFISYYIKRGLVLFILSSILFYTIIQVAVKLQIIPFIFKPDIIYFIYFFIVSLIIEVVIPILLKKVKLH